MNTYYFIPTNFNAISGEYLRILTFVFSAKEDSQNAMKKHLGKELALYKNVVCRVKAILDTF